MLYSKHKYDSKKNDTSHQSQNTCRVIPVEVVTEEKNFITSSEMNLPILFQFIFPFNYRNKSFIG